MKTENALLVIGGFLLVVYLLFRKAKDNLQNAAADTLIGGTFLGVRSVEAASAAEWIKTRKWLTKAYRNWLLEHYNITQYSFNLLQESDAEDIAKEIVQANTVIFGNSAFDTFIAWGLENVGQPIDHPDDVITAVSRINNQVQALQVVEWYYLKTGKNLSAGLQWLPDAAITIVYNHLKELPTGVFASSGQYSVELASLPNQN